MRDLLSCVVRDSRYYWRMPMEKIIEKSDQETMKILVLSDSHGDGDTLLRIVEAHQAEIDGLIFLGDGAEEIVELSYIYPDLPIYSVTGNNDRIQRGGRVSFPLERVVEIMGRRIYLTHGHITDYHDVAEVVIARARSESASIALHGHLHIPNRLDIDDVVLLSPGSIRYPRGGSESSYMIITISDTQLDVQKYATATLMKS